MSIDQVKAVQPAAEPRENPEAAPDGAACSLRIASLNIGDAPFFVCFFFKDEKLVQVALGSNDKPKMSTAFATILELNRRFGRKGAGGATGDGLIGQWSLDGGVSATMVWYDGLSGKPANLAINIRVAN